MSGDEDGEQRRRYLRWSDELQAAYLDALEQCGGLQDARPKALLDLLQPRFPFLTLQHVKNHLQKQRTKEARGGGGALHGSSPVADSSPVAGSQGGPMERDAVEAASGGSGGPPTRGPPAPAGPTLWLPDSFAHQPAGAAASESDVLIDLAKRALAVTVHQLALYRKLLEELEQQAGDHAQLAAGLRHDPSGGSLLQGAQCPPDAAGSFDQPERLRRLLARLLPPNPFSSGPKAEAAMKLAAWMAARAREATGGGGTAQRRPLLATPNVLRAEAGELLPRGGGTAASLAAAAGDGVAGGAAALGHGGSDDAAAAALPHELQRRKRHKALSELLAEIPLADPPASPRAAAGPAAAPTAAADVADVVQAQPAGGAEAELAQGLAPSLALLLQQHLRQPQQAQQAQLAVDGRAPLAPPLPLALQAGGDVEMQQQPPPEEDPLMLYALDAQMSSLLLQSMSHALARSARDAGDRGGSAAEALAAPPLPNFGDLSLGLGEEQLPADQADLSVLRSVLDMLSSGSAPPPALGSPPHRGR